jgi:hypothetical protein
MRFARHVDRFLRNRIASLGETRLHNGTPSAVASRRPGCLCRFSRFSTVYLTVFARLNPFFPFFTVTALFAINFFALVAVVETASKEIPTQFFTWFAIQFSVDLRLESASNCLNEPGRPK